MEVAEQTELYLNVSQVDKRLFGTESYDYRTCALAVLSLDDPEASPTWFKPPSLYETQPCKVRDHWLQATLGKGKYAVVLYVEDTPAPIAKQIEVSGFPSQCTDWNGLYELSEERSHGVGKTVYTGRRCACTDAICSCEGKHDVVLRQTTLKGGGSYFSGIGKTNNLWVFYQPTGGLKCCMPLSAKFTSEMSARASEDKEWSPLPPEGVICRGGFNWDHDYHTKIKSTVIEKGVSPVTSMALTTYSSKAITMLDPSLAAVEAAQRHSEGRAKFDGDWANFKGKSDIQSARHEKTVEQQKLLDEHAYLQKRCMFKQEDGQRELCMQRQSEISAALIEDGLGPRTVHLDPTALTYGAVGSVVAVVGACAFGICKSMQR
jgi:hypothetical protein